MSVLRPGAVLLSHWDNFFSPLTSGAKPLPAMKMPRLVEMLTAEDRSVKGGRRADLRQRGVVIAD